VWHAPTTPAKDRKRILRLLLKDITVYKAYSAKQLLVHLRWQGGASTHLTVQLPLSIADRVRYPAALVDKVRELAHGLPDAEIANRLNREGHASAKGKPYTTQIVRWIRGRYQIPPATLRRPEELTVQQVEIYPCGEGAIPVDRALAHRNEEFPAGYSSGGCSPAVLVFASPASAVIVDYCFDAKIFPGNGRPSLFPLSQLRRAVSPSAVIRLNQSRTRLEVSYPNRIDRRVNQQLQNARDISDRLMDLHSNCTPITGV
jgi:hypothetical protein